MRTEDGDPQANGVAREATGRAGPRTARWRPRRGDDASIASIRAWVRRTLPRLLGRPAGGRLRDSAELLVSELAANALIHAGGIEHIDLCCSDTTLRISVHDPSSAAPVAHSTRGPDDDNGRGLMLVNALAVRWGNDEHPDDGKDVWLELAVDR
jgi:hypothetical protein